MTAYRIQADALLRLALIADSAPGANAGTILTLLREAEPIAASTDEPAADPADAPAEDPEADGADKIAKPE